MLTVPHESIADNKNIPIFFPQSPLRILFELDKNIASNWDLYLITILTLILGTVFYFRRPPVPNAERYAPPTITPSPPSNSSNGTPQPEAPATPAPAPAEPDNPDAIS